jgi:hypothetical protein
MKNDKTNKAEERYRTTHKRETQLEAKQNTENYSALCFCFLREILRILGIMPARSSWQNNVTVPYFVTKWCENTVSERQDVTSALHISSPYTSWIKQWTLAIHWFQVCCQIHKSTIWTLKSVTPQNVRSYTCTCTKFSCSVFIAQQALELYMLHTFRCCYFYIKIIIFLFEINMF